jgi:hypothetical protein
MTRKLYIVISALLVLGLATFIFAVNRAGASAAPSIGDKSCCAKKDACPMKDHKAGENKASCCGDCCKDGKCDMKKHGENAASCCENCACCKDKDSCPMKGKKEGHPDHPAAATTSADGESCCGCACCGKKDK